MTDTELALLVEAVVSCQAPPGVATRIVGIDGHGGAGKSTLAEWVSREVAASVVHTDDFASWDNPVDWWPNLIAFVLRPLAAGEEATYLPTRWAGETPVPVSVEPGGIVVVDGVTATREAFRPYLALSIWVETPRGLCLQRGIERDGPQSRAQWERWMHEEDQYVDRERPDLQADLVLRGDRNLWI